MVTQDNIIKLRHTKLVTQAHTGMSTGKSKSISPNQNNHW